MSQSFVCVIEKKQQKKRSSQLKEEKKKQNLTTRHTKRKQLINEHCTNSIHKISFQWRQGTNKYIHIYIFTMCMILQKKRKKRQNKTQKTLYKQQQKIYK
jgi:hypothetical protein